METSMSNSIKEVNWFLKKIFGRKSIYKASDNVKVSYNKWAVCRDNFQYLINKGGLVVIQSIHSTHCYW